MLRGIFTKLFQSCFITLCVIRYGDRNVTSAQIITAQRDIMSVTVIFIVLGLLVQVIIQNLQVVADTVQLLIVNIPQIIRGSGKGISRAGEILDMGLTLGVVQKSGSWISYNGERLGQGRDNARKAIEQNSALFDELDAKIRSMGDKLAENDDEFELDEDSDDDLDIKLADDGSDDL